QLEVAYMIDADAVAARAKAAASPVRGQRRQRLHEYLLRRVFGILRVIQHADGDVVDPGLMASDQRLERGPVAGLGAKDERAILRVRDGMLREGIDGGPHGGFSALNRRSVGRQAPRGIGPRRGGGV